MRRPIILLVLGVLACGCTSQGPRVSGPDVVFIVPGVGGPTGYDALIDSVRRPNCTIEMVKWGAPPPLFFMNYSDKGIHDSAEQQFAAILERWHNAHPTGRIDVIGHSAGSGVALGAIARLKTARVHQLVLLAPSVSPTYDLKPALARLQGRIHVYTSTGDTLLEWRTSNFSTYDRVPTAAAGVAGFTGDFPRDRVAHYAFNPRWTALGHDGGHWGPLADRFTLQMIAPLLAQNRANPEQSLSVRHTPN